MGSEYWRDELGVAVHGLIASAHAEVERLRAASTERAAVVEEAMLAAKLSAWKHVGDDPYSQGMDAGARHQIGVTLECLRALAPAAAVARLRELPALLEWLRGLANEPGDEPISLPMRDAKALLSRIAALEEALRPFVALCDEIEGLSKQTGIPPEEWAKACWWEDLVLARAALKAAP
jgi:hypothetical protein